MALLRGRNGEGVAALTVVEANAAEPALVYYTSGTTGNPKAVMHSHFYTGAHWVTGKYWIDLKPTDLFW